MSRRKLLLADDSITIQKVVNLTFADEGVEVVTVGDGDAALAELASARPDILLVDVNMPGPSGYEICERMRANEETRNLPVILLVGSFEPFDEAEASRVGANAYLTKPFQSIKQLISQVNELIEAASPTVAGSVSPPVKEEVEPPASEVASPEVANVADLQPGTAGEVPTAAAESTADAESEVELLQAEPRFFDDLGYETSEAPAQPAAEQPDDIDGLYAQSLSGGGPDDLLDVGIDDEMIETSYTTGNSNSDLAAFRSEVEADSGVHEPDLAQVGDISLETLPGEAESAVQLTSGYEPRFPQDPSKFENTISYENWRPADMRVEDQESAGSTPDSQVDSDRSFETTRLDEPGPQSIANIPPESPTVGEDTIRMENRFDTTGSSSFQFDDVNLLDLSDNSEAPVEITTPVNAVEQGSNKQVVTLAPELIEMIAQRVVEKLSEKY